MPLRYILLTLFLALLGCGRSPVIPADIAPDLSQQYAATGRSEHVSWGTWLATLDPETLSATVVQTRRSDFHIDVTQWLQPPNCDGCIKIILTKWDPSTRIVDVTLVLTNPTTLTGYDVKAILSNYGTKEFIEPDAYADFYTDGTTWDPYYLFAENEPKHAFKGEKSHAVGFQVKFPFGASPNVTITVDASWPGPQEEPWRINNIVIAGPLQNNNVNHIAFTCHIYDQQDDVQVVYADLTPIGPSSVPMGDDSHHKDFLAGDDIWGLDEIKTSAAPGKYPIWIRAKSLASDHYTYQKLTLEVIAPVISPPPLYIVSMMHAEEDVKYLNQTTLLGYTATLRKLVKVFDKHGAKIAFQPDWTFIQGVINFDPTVFTELQADGHGVDTHAHESQYDIGYVHDLLDLTGVQDTIVVNGGFENTWGVDGNWAAYIAHFTGSGGDQMFRAVVAYKDAKSQSVEALYTPIRPSTTGDWMVHDPDGPLVYIPGTRDTNANGSNPNFWNLLPSAVDYALAGVIPGKINCFYWHDPAVLYSGNQLSLTRLDFWDILLKNYFDKKVAQGLVEWANFNEMYQHYIEWEG